MSSWKIVTHPGRAHRDDFISVCLLLDHLRDGHGNPLDVKVERREPAEEDLNDPNVFVVDVGGLHVPCNRNFDHHQLPSDAEPTCAMSMVLQYLGLYEVAMEASGEWIEFTERLDSKGPINAGGYFNISQDALSRTLSPIESQLLIHWAEYPMDVAWLMGQLGSGWKKYWKKFRARMDLLKDVCTLTPLAGTKGVVFVSIHCVDDPSFGLEKFFVKSGLDPAVVVTFDDRGPGYSLHRRNDDPNIDFRQIAADPRARFVHANGFIAKTVEGLNRDHLMELLIASVVRA